jgi:hypothetical protein
VSSPGCVNRHGTTTVWPRAALHEITEACPALMR